MINNNGLSKSVEVLETQPEVSILSEKQFHNRLKRKQKCMYQVVHPQHKKPKLEKEGIELIEDQ